MLSDFLFKYVYRVKPIPYPDPNGTVPKSVLMMAPHTSIMDFVIGLAVENTRETSWSMPRTSSKNANVSL